MDVWVACADQIDRAGLQLPGDRQAWRHAHTIPEVLGKDWPPVELLSAIAILQHYGGPTRLLDWCRGGLTAAYFAAKDRALAVCGEKPRGVRYRSAFLAVWALDLEFVRNNWDNANKVAEVSIVGAPYATNPNLHAQQGVFTLDRSETPRALENVVAAKHAEVAPSAPTALHKLMLPANQAPELMRLLALSGVSAASVYPGYAGAIEAVREERLHVCAKRRGPSRA